MKKLLTAVSAVALAVCAQAASVDWKVTGTETEVNYSVYLMVGDTATTTWGSAADIAAAAIDTGSIAKAGRSYGVGGTATNDTLTKSDNFYFVIVSADGAKYAVSDVYAGATYVYDTAATPPESAPSVTPSFAANTASYASFGAVPEPTSGLLLLLGMAGLALKRKRA